MKEERMFILNMLNEGKITADDACKLLAALKKDEKISSAEIGEKVNKYAKTVKDKVVKIAKDAEPKVKKYADVVNDKIEDIKTGIKSRKNTASDSDDIIVDITEEAADTAEAVKEEISEAVVDETEKETE